MNLSVSIEKEHLAFLVISLLVVSWIGLAVAVNPGVSHPADEIYIGTDTLQDVVDTSKGSLLVMHSQTTTIPDCPGGWTKLWDGYSFIAAYLSAGYEAPQDLGSTGSCLKEFRSTPQIECSSPNACDYFTTGDYSMWLSTKTTDEGGVSGSNMVSRIGRCAVCSK